MVGDGCRAGGSDEDRGVNEGESNGTQLDVDCRFAGGDGGGRGARGVGRRAWWETVTKMEVWTLGSRTELDRMDTVGSWEVMACIGVEDMDHWERRKVNLRVRRKHFRLTARTQFQ